MENKRRSYLSKVTEQIRSKEAKKYVSAELNHHLQETKNVWMKKGLTEEEAENKAIEQMGSPVTLGVQLNKIHRPKVDWMMFILLMAILCLGLLPMFTLDYLGFGNFLMNKIVIMLLGIGVTLSFMFFDYRKLKQYKWLFFSLGMFILLLLQFFPNVYINGVPRFKVGPLTIESSMALPFFLLFLASFFTSKTMNLWKTILLFFLPIFMFFSFPNLIDSFMYSIMAFVMIWWSGIRFKKVLGATFSFLAFVGMLIAIMWSSYQTERLLSILNPGKYSEELGYLTLRAQELILDAGWFGSASKVETMPDPYTNFVFVNFTYHYGWVLAGILIVLLSLLMIRMLFVLKNIKDSFGKMLIVGGVTLFSVQFIYHIGMAMGWLPQVSMSLPFISYGLMPTLLNAMIVGIFLSVYRRKDLAYSVQT